MKMFNWNKYIVLCFYRLEEGSTEAESPSEDWTKVCSTCHLGSILLKVHLTPKCFLCLLNIKVHTCFKNISPLFAVFDFFYEPQNLRKTKASLFCRTTKSEGAWVYSGFDVTNCFACMFNLQTNTQGDANQFVM